MNLEVSVEALKGVGPKTAAALKKAGILTVGDLLYFLPRDYEDYQSVTEIAAVRPGRITVRGRITDLTTKRTRRRNLTITTGAITDGTGVIRVMWFNQPYRAKAFDEKAEYYFSGVYDFKNGRYQLTSPTVALADAAAAASFRPVYPVRGSLKSAQFAKLLGLARPLLDGVPDLLPTGAGAPALCRPGARKEALFQVHFPENATEVEQGRKYLAYEEIFELVLAAQLNKRENQRLGAEKLPFVAENTRKLVASLPFRLTDAQRRATWEILQDLDKAVPMNRLLQGDVGSGKTVVAALAAWQAAAAGAQTAILAPTAILANQHAETLQEILAPLGVNVALLTGATKQKTALKKHIAAGEAQVVVGTHALLTDDTEFQNLALCVIDEQHRFGVAQRQKLLLKSPAGTAPHLLAMTATPIPRSLQLTVFGDLEVSVINQLPAGRQAIQTQILNELHLREDLYPKIRTELDAGRQAYWICKAIDDNPATETASVKKQAKKLQELFPKYRVEFLHGRMKPAEKDEIVARFAAGEIQILVSTTVVEVGVNVPNATLMVIMDAEQYGLAQLHQLRGRVGRGQFASFCYLITTGEGAPSRRLRELEHSTDGFHLAEVDLELRGPGEIYGSLQHGALDLRIATLADTPTIAAASRHVKAFLQEPDCMLKYKELAQHIQKYQQLTTLN